LIGKLSPVPISILPNKKTGKVWNSTPKKAGLPQFFFTAQKNPFVFWGKVGFGKIGWAQDMCPQWCPSFGIDLELLFLEKNNPQQNGTAKDLTKSGVGFWQTFWKKKTMDHILHGRILVWIRGTVCHVT